MSTLDPGLGTSTQYTVSPTQLGLDTSPPYLVYKSGSHPHHLSDFLSASESHRCQELFRYGSYLVDRFQEFLLLASTGLVLTSTYTSITLVI